jgi:hypothetical protein
MKKLEFEGADIARANETMPGIRQSTAAPAMIRRARRQETCTPPAGGCALQGTGRDTDDRLDVSIARLKCEAKRRPER